jgi:hypothetical protein
VSGRVVRAVNGHAVMGPTPRADALAITALSAAWWEGQDVGEFLARALARLAVELGGSEAVIANRPESWEAALVRDLLTGTGGAYDEHLNQFRT